MHYFPRFRQTSSIGTLKRLHKERMCSPVDFNEELNAVFEVKMSQIDTDNDKKTPNFPFFKVFMNFSSSFDRLG